jgi:hypothetical protein
MKTLTEGLGVKQLRYSPKLYQYIKDIQKKALFIENPQTRDSLSAYVMHITKVADEFKETERLYDLGKRKEARKQYNVAKKEYLNVLKNMKKDSETNQILTQTLGYVKYFAIMQLFNIALTKIGGLLSPLMPTLPWNKAPDKVSESVPVKT